MDAALYVVAYLYAFWCAYILVMGVYRAHMTRRLVGVTRGLALPVVLIGYALDVAANLTIAVLLFADPPREMLVTGRLIRYKAGPPGWRRSVAEYVCDNLLDPFDPRNDHC